MNRLVSDEGHDPLAHLIAGEERAGLPDMDTAHPSRAGAWLMLLRSCGNHMPAVAARLPISVSYAYRRCAEARRIASLQGAIALTPPRSTDQLGP